LTSITRKTSTDASAPHVDTSLSYNARNLLKTITHTSSAAGALATFSYSYDAGTRLINSSGPEGSLTYTYDQVAQLTGVTGARTESYSYDLNGNRTSANGVSYGTPAAGNRLTNDGTYTYTYDNQGNLLTKTLIADTTQQTLFTWDYRNRLTEVVVKSGTTTLQDDRFTYDVLDRRIGKSTLSGGQQWTVYDGADPYADFNGSGSLTYRYLYGNEIDDLFARFDGTNAVWYLDDLLGSVRQLVNTNGLILDQITYDCYGNIPTGGETNPGNGDRFKYTVREYDSEIGLYYYRVRYYGPGIGRFLGEDPIGFAAGDVNFYRYVDNEPASATDPNGLIATWDTRKGRKGLLQYQFDIIRDLVPDLLSESRKILLFVQRRIAESLPDDPIERDIKLRMIEGLQNYVEKELIPRIKELQKLQKDINDKIKSKP
jgi:RHS repeat-associated protein